MRFPGQRDKSLMKPKYSKYTLPGGEDYKEMLLTMPIKGDKLPDGYNKQVQMRRICFIQDYPFMVLMIEAYGGEIGSVDDFYDFDYFSDKPEMMEDISKAVQDAGGKGKVFQSGHWSEENVLAHVRFDTRTTTDGKSVLFVEEIQSDWAQKGKERESFGTR